MFNLLRIYNKNFWKSLFGPLITFMLPVVFIWLVLSIYTFTYQNKDISLNAATTPTVLFTTFYIIMLILLPQAIFEIKDSVLIKQLKTSSIKLWHVLLAGWLYYSAMSIVSFFLSIISSVMTPTKFVIDENVKMYGQTNWWILLFVLLINICMAGSFGTMMASIFKCSSIINMVGVSIIFLSLLLGGLMVPLMLASEQLPIVWYTSYADFIRYGTTQIYEALYSTPSKLNIFGSNMFDISTPYEAFATELVPIKFSILNRVDKILNLSIPYISTLIFTITSVKTFKI